MSETNDMPELQEKIISLDGKDYQTLEWNEGRSKTISLSKEHYDLTIELKVNSTFVKKGDSLEWSRVFRYKWFNKLVGLDSRAPFQTLPFDSPKAGLFYAELSRPKPEMDCLYIELIEDDRISTEVLSACSMKVSGEAMLGMEKHDKRFSRHLDDGGNQQVFFSAPFGTGKSTFLNYFFDRNSERYDVFHLYPVNYAVSSNDDIMEYIKARLLGEFLSRDVVLEDNDFSDWIYMHQWLLARLNNPENILEGLGAMIGLFPSIDPSGGMVTKVLSQLSKLNKSFETYKKKHKDNSEKTQAGVFLSGVNNQKGSLYDQGFIRQLLISLVRRNRADSGKQQVLVIDDLDRMDPEHIFRIMNVLAAHFDHEDYVNGNKFGFDKVILVGDYHNIRHIYQHKYGEKTDFAGYINKFFSRGIYSYGLEMAVIDFSERIYNRFKCRILDRIIADMLKSGAMNIREYRRLWRLKDRYTQDRKGFTVLRCEKAYELFMQIMDHDTLMVKLKRCQELIKGFPDNYPASGDSYYTSFVTDMEYVLLNLFLYSGKKIQAGSARRTESNKFTITPNIGVRNISLKAEVDRNSDGLYFISNKEAILRQVRKYSPDSSTDNHTDDTSLPRTYVYEHLIEIFGSFQTDI
ncbi:hypothetical protein K5X82_16985 [Halosquirtibacter xylanolyticus]|uniref:P-loop NTPase fold protein n=1 Tax=Halosquirtibacter xylanolyticus TaxID=3374599 RepID=UPI00374976DF|nr:hypothetical protein K5X82_16985 [Prolixibacteraceae bacterium]